MNCKSFSHRYFAILAALRWARLVNAHTEAMPDLVHVILCPATAQVCRMLRLSSSEQQNVLRFQGLHSVARAEGFGRLFRSPTGWEDLIKSILLCNCGWVPLCIICCIGGDMLALMLDVLPGECSFWHLCILQNTTWQSSKTYAAISVESMSDVMNCQCAQTNCCSFFCACQVPKLCLQLGNILPCRLHSMPDRQVHHHTPLSQIASLHKTCFLTCTVRWSRTLGMNQALCATVGQGAFPSPAMLIQAGVQRLQSHCGLGYRAKTVIRLAEQVSIFLADVVHNNCATS